jgi:hypothetical protein
MSPPPPPQALNPHDGNRPLYPHELLRALVGMAMERYEASATSPGSSFVLDGGGEAGRAGGGADIYGEDEDAAAEGEEEEAEEEDVGYDLDSLPVSGGGRGGMALEGEPGRERAGRRTAQMWEIGKGGGRGGRESRSADICRADWDVVEGVEEEEAGKADAGYEPNSLLILCVCACVVWEEDYDCLTLSH